MNPTPGTNPGNLFSTLGYATEIAAPILAGIAALESAQPNDNLPSGAVAPAVIDAINGPNADYASNFSVPPPATLPPPPSYVSIFELKGNIMIGSQMYLIQQTLGPFGARALAPDMAQGDQNYIQVGHGADAVNAPVAGTPVLIALNIPSPGSQGLAQPYWGPPYASGTSN